RDATVARAPFRTGTDALERTGHLCFRGRVRRDGTPSARNEPRLRRPRALRTFSLALHFCPNFSARGLHRFYLVGSERNRADRFLLGRLARDDANLRLLPNLCRENGVIWGVGA